MIRILIAEDHQSLIDGLKLLFDRDHEIKIIGTSNDGKELLEIIQHKKPHLVLTDINMPRMNGVELCKKIKELHPAIKVLAYSMYESEVAVRDMIEAQCDGYILKKRPLSDVRNAIISIYRGTPYFDPSINQECSNPENQSDIQLLLSKSELAILHLIAQNKTSPEIAEERHTAVSTVFKHRKNIIKKLGLNASGELYKYAVSQFKHFQ
jgi:two-component system nitrate/nitrite response regulator NarL